LLAIATDLATRLSKRSPNQHTDAGIDVAFSGRTARRYLSAYSSICLLKNALYLDDIMR